MLTSDLRLLFYLELLLIISQTVSGFKCVIDGKCRETEIPGRGCITFTNKHKDYEEFKFVSSEICRKEFFPEEEESSCFWSGPEGQWRRVLRSREMKKILKDKHWDGDDKIHVCCCWGECCNQDRSEEIAKYREPYERVSGSESLERSVWSGVRS